MDTNEIDFVNRPGDFEDLVGQIQKAKKGVQYYVPATEPAGVTRGRAAREGSRAQRRDPDPFRSRGPSLRSG